MSEKQYTVDAMGQVQEDRRTHHRAREAFPEAFAMLAPMLAASPEVSGYALARALQDRFGELESLEVDIMVIAIRRLHQSGQTPTD
ncbi:MAG: hypothetical protein PHR30_17135 [Gallionellaceae bacterium]|nr:hypothetical protein [Gallionellaceae bacterium]